MKLKTKLIIGLVIISIIALGWIYFTKFAGRSSSRLLGVDYAQVLKVDNVNANKFISVSFTKQGDSTVKDVTFEGTDSFIYTQEFKDLSPLEGVIRWVPYGSSASMIQSRAISRWTGGAIELVLPENCDKVLNIDIGYASNNERVKNVTCQITDGSLISKEYREGFIDRNFSGYLKIQSKQKPKE